MFCMQATPKKQYSRVSLHYLSTTSCFFLFHVDARSSFEINLRFNSNGGAESAINNWVKLAWMKWKQLTGVLCDKKISINLKDKVHKMVIKPKMTYMEQCVGRLEKRREQIVAEIRMLRRIRGKTRKYHVRNQVIQKEGGEGDGEREGEREEEEREREREREREAEGKRVWIIVFVIR